MSTQHHYVPQFYLRQFASPEEQIWVYDKQKDRSFCTSVRNVATERFFYDSDMLEKTMGDRQALEKLLSRIEGQFGDKIDRLLNRLRSGGYRRLHPETRTVIATFAAVQLLRTREHRINQKHIVQQMIKFLRKQPKTEKLIAEAEAAMTEEALRESQVRMLLDLPTIMDFSNILASHIWIIGHRHPQQCFYTSDEPVTKYGNIHHPFRGTDGINSKGVEVHLPLSPDYSLTLYERSHFKWMESKDGTIQELTDPLEMTYSRKWAVMYSSRFVFCQEDDFDLARDICNREPHWRDPDRPRFTSNHDDEPLPPGVR